MLLLVTGTWKYVLLKGGIQLQLEPGPKDRKKERKDNKNVWKRKGVFLVHKIKKPLWKGATLKSGILPQIEIQGRKNEGKKWQWKSV